MAKHDWDCLNTYLDKHQITYTQYLESEHWQLLRQDFWSSQIIRRCFVCLSRKKRLDVHHNTYKNIGAETFDDLILLCSNCHRRVHEIEKSGFPLDQSANELRRIISKPKKKRTEITWLTNVVEPSQYDAERQAAQKNPDIFRANVRKARFRW